MNGNFIEQSCKCPKCGEDLTSGTTQLGVDVQMVKRCVAECGFWMIVVIPNDEYDYSISRQKKLTEREQDQKEAEYHKKIENLITEIDTIASNHDSTYYRMKTTNIPIFQLIRDFVNRQKRS